MDAAINVSQFGQSCPTGPSPSQSGELQDEMMMPSVVICAPLGALHDGQMPISFEESPIAAVAILDASDSIVSVVPPSMNCGYHKMSIIRAPESMVKRMYAK